MIRELDDKGVGQNKVLSNFSGVKLPWSTIIQALRQCFLRQEDRFLAIRLLLALETH